MAFLLNLAFTIFEIFGGLMTNSVAILSDAVHDAGDSLSLGLAWILHRVSDKRGDDEYTYGYRRFSVLGALITSALLIGGLAFVLVHAIGRLSDPEPVSGTGMMLIAVVGIIVNGLAVLRLRKGTSLNEKLASWHLLEDVLGWIAVLVGGAVVHFWGIHWIDPVLSILISIFVLWNVVRNLRQVMAVFLQRKPAGFNLAEFKEKVLASPGVKEIHHTHTWTLDGEHHVLTTHVVLDAISTRQEVAAIKERVRSFLDHDAFEHVTIDVELEGEACASGRCQDASGHSHPREEHSEV